MWRGGGKVCGEGGRCVEGGVEKLEKRTCGIVNM